MKIYKILANANFKQLEKDMANFSEHGYKLEKFAVTGVDKDDADILYVVMSRRRKGKVVEVEDVCGEA